MSPGIDEAFRGRERVEAEDAHTSGDPCTNTRRRILDHEASLGRVAQRGRGMEEEIRSALREVMQGRTTVIISHRLSTISLADQVVLVDEGRAGATGTHAELMRSSQRYREVLGQLEAMAS